MSEIISINVNSSNNKVGVLSGPNLAKEIAEKKVTGTVIASLDNTLIDDVKMVLASETFKVYSSNDVQGVELAGSLKNVYAIICGIADSLGVGENAVGLILTRSMAEMSRFAVARGANPITFLGLAGMGDLVATCSSNLSRNFQFGFNFKGGLSFNLGDVIVPEEKQPLIESANKKVDEIKSNYSMGFITNNERYNQVTLCLRY
jgi:glycerol-3-phosphate dehydrogenase (NAD(P)+)